MHLRNASTRRPAYTLIELLVVISIILAIAGILLVFYPSSADKRVSSGASKVQSTLFIAKQRAFREHRPAGIRLFYDGANVTEIAYIAQPEDYQAGTVSLNGTTATFSQSLTDLVNASDLLEMRDNNALYKLTAATGTTATLDRTAPTTAATGAWIIIRQPQPLAGEPTILLPLDVVIKGDKCVPAITGTTDILFGPAGPVVGRSSSQSRIVLWLEDSTGSSKEKTLLAIFTRTGRTALFPVGPAGNEYQFVTDGSAGGV